MLRRRARGGVVPLGRGGWRGGSARAARRVAHLGGSGHILRDDHDKLILHNTVRSLYHDNIEGSILNDAPPTTTFEELKHYASDRARWRKHINTIFKESSSQSQTVSGPGPPATREARRDKSNARLNTPQTSSSTNLLGPSPNRPTTTITSNSNTNSATTCGVFTSNKS